MQKPVAAENISPAAAAAASFAEAQRVLTAGKRGYRDVGEDALGLITRDQRRRIY